MYRILLLLLLSAVAVLFYLEGQRYDPALIDFKSSAISSGPALLPDEFAGYNLKGRVRIFTADNLYEYINGHAEYFISAGFEGLSVGEYVKVGTEQRDPEVVVEIYDLGRNIQAFGVLADEAGDTPIESMGGIMGFRGSQGMSFIAGKYYVKINTYRDETPILELAGLIDDEIGGRSDFLDAFSSLPDLGTPVATRFIREAYRGLDFVDNVIEREYSLDGNQVQVFLVAGEEEEISGLKASYLDFFRESEVECLELEEGGKQFYKVLDPYEGNWFLIPGGDVLFGIYGTQDVEIVKKIIIASGGEISAGEE